MNNFDLKPYKNKWFSWDRINNCFWPGAGCRSDDIDSELSPVRLMSGIYVISWDCNNSKPSPNDDAVKYIGMTNLFKKRMEQFAASSGLHYDDRYNGHSAAWRWPLGKDKLMKVAFYPLEDNLPFHLKSGILHWYEALAIYSYYQSHQDEMPPLNAGGGTIKF